MRWAAYKWMQWRKPTFWFSSYLIASPNQIDLLLLCCWLGLAVQGSVCLCWHSTLKWLLSPSYIISKINYGIFPTWVFNFPHPFILFISCLKGFSSLFLKENVLESLLFFSSDFYGGILLLKCSYTHLVNRLLGCYCLGVINKHIYTVRVTKACHSVMGWSRCPPKPQGIELWGGSHSSSVGYSVIP